MKRRFWSIFSVLLLLMLLALPVQASEYRFVFDEAVLLTTPKAEQLDEMAADLSVRYDCGVYIVTVLDYTEYGSDVRSAAENFFLDHDLGLGSDANGVLLMLSMLERDYALIAHGDLGNTAFTDYGKEILSEAFLDDFRYDSWAAGFADYLSTSEEFLHAASTGAPVDVQQESGSGQRRDSFEALRNFDNQEKSVIWLKCPIRKNAFFRHIFPFLNLCLCTFYIK